MILPMAGDPTAAPATRPDMAEVDFERAPFLVIWETTQACDLACLHCRAEARPCRDDGELSTAEAKAMMERVRAFGRPLFVLTGGDPAKRPDVAELVAHGAGLGLRMGMTPSATPLMTPSLVRRLARAGLSRLAVSLDGPDPESHDRFRGVEGSFDWTLRILATAREEGLSTQVNTTVSRYNVERFEALVELMERMDIALWSVFFLVPTGRAKPEDVASPDALEAVYNRLYDLSRTAPFDIKSTAAPQYRRVILQRQVAERRAGDRTAAPEPLTAGLGFSLADGVGRARGVNDGSGFLFVSHRGALYPSGFLPVTCGNVRSDDLVEVYRSHPLFRSLRDPDALRGKCGVCEYRQVCGGSRARAWALTGDPLESDPLCAHEPARWTEDTDAYFRARVAGWPIWEGSA